MPSPTFSLEYSLYSVCVFFCVVVFFFSIWELHHCVVDTAINKQTKKSKSRSKIGQQRQISVWQSNVLKLKKRGTADEIALFNSADDHD